MTLESINIYTLRIPFSQGIDHNLKARKFSDSIVLEVRTTDGLIGYGEGTPRCYVTGETTEQVVTAFRTVLENCSHLKVKTLQEVRQLIGWLNTYHQIPSMVAGLEIALLDLLGQYNSSSIADFISEPGIGHAPVYSGVLPFLPSEKRISWLKLIKSLQLKAVKIKVGQADDVATLALARDILGPEVDIRLDANRAWTLQKAVEKIKSLEAFGISSIEEPLMDSHIMQLPELSSRIDTPIMLDESLLNIQHAAYYAERMAPQQWLINLKISKVGGLLAASNIHHFASSKGIQCQLGCHVGESAILTAAGRLFAQSHELLHLEGAYAPFFMEDDISQMAISFYKGGLAPVLTAPGLGISVDPEKIKQYGRLVCRIGATKPQYATY